MPFDRNGLLSGYRQWPRGAALYDQDLERIMLQFGTHFCIHQFFAFAASHCLRQISWHDFFCANAGADTDSKPSATTADTTFIILSTPKERWRAYRPEVWRTMSPAGALAVFYVLLMLARASRPRRSG